VVKKYGWRDLIRALEQSAMSAISEPVRPIQLSEIQEARKRIANIIVRTPLIRLELGAEFPDAQLKLEPALIQIFRAATFANLTAPARVEDCRPQHSTLA